MSLALLKSNRFIRRRRGVTTLTALGGLVLSLTVLAVVVDLGRLSLSRQRLQFAADAAALAAATELRDTSSLYPGVAGSASDSQQMDGGFRQQAAKLQAESYITENVTADKYLGISSAPSLELVVGAVDEDGFYEQDDLSPATAVEVKLAFSHAQGNGLSLLMARWFGGDNADVRVRSVAKLDQAVVGFRPGANAAVPCVPIVLQYAEINGWAKQATARTTAAFNDRVRFDELAGQTSVGADGIPELVFMVGAAAGDDTPVSGWIAQFGASDRSGLTRQIKSGLNAADLHETGGKLVVGEDESDFPISAARDEQIDMESLVEELRSLQGQSRIWPLGQKRDRGIGIEQFAAGRLVDCYLVRAGVMAVVIQPCLMQTSTAITRPGVESNPWIAKLELAY